MKAIDTATTFDYVPLCDRDLPEGEQVVFEIKPLTPTFDRILDNMIGSVRDGAMDMRIGDQTYTALCMGLAGVRNFNDKAGKPIAVKWTGRKLHGSVPELSDDFVKFIPKEVRFELAKLIMDGSEIGDTEAKN